MSQNMQYNIMCQTKMTGTIKFVSVKPLKWQICTINVCDQLLISMLVIAYPSTSFSGATAFVHADGSIGSEESGGSWTIIPWMEGSLFSSSTFFKTFRKENILLYLLYHPLDLIPMLTKPFLFESILQWHPPLVQL